MEFEWDPRQAAANLAKHGVGSSEAMTVFGDALEVMIADPDQSEGEFRFLSIGVSAAGRVLVVAYAEREGRTRLISARKATATERKQYASTTRAGARDEMRPEYDFSRGIRGKHYEAYLTGTNVVFLEADVAEVFTNSAAVNEALRLLMKVARTNAQMGASGTRRRPAGRLGKAVNTQKRLRSSRR